MSLEAFEHTETTIPSAQRKGVWLVLLAVAALAVAGLTVWALVLPGATMANQTFCGMQEHQHSGTCYKDVLVCGMQEGDSEASSAGDGASDEGSSDESSAPPSEAEATEGDSSSASEAPEGAPSSTGEEAEASSSDILSAVEESSAALASEPATSSDATAGDAVVLSAPTAAHAATSASGATGHVHTEACYQRQLVCETQEHTHSLACYSNATADVETQETWEATLPSDDELTGEWAVDVLTVAESQLGYTESSANYVVSQNASGAETAKGYSRYGAWYGDAHGDWCAMFVSFCLHYADVPEEAVPLNANCQNWIETLAAEEVQLWRPMVDGTPIIPEEAADGDVKTAATDTQGDAVEASSNDVQSAATETSSPVILSGATEGSAVEESRAASAEEFSTEAEDPMVYAPKPGDLVFFDWDEDGTADHVGIVRELTEATEDEPAKLKTVEGNAWDGTTAADAVCYQEYDQDSPSIMGYGELPEQIFYCGLKGHVHSESCYDGAGQVVCGLGEHIHSESCEDPSSSVADVPTLQAVKSVSTSASNPKFTVQYYANIPRFATDGGTALTVIDTSADGNGGKATLPTNGGEMKTTEVYLEDTGEKTTQNAGVDTSLYKVKTETKLTRIYEEEGFEYAKAPDLYYFNKFGSDESYDVAEIWVLKEGKDESSVVEEDWEIYKYDPQKTRFTNDEAAVEDDVILIKDGATIRLVSSSSSGSYVNETTFYDYDISDGQDSSGRWITGTKGINSKSNYGTSADGETTWESHCNTFAFGNSNCGTGLSGYYFGGGPLNKWNGTRSGSEGYTGVNENYGGCTFELVEGLNSDGTIKYDDCLIVPNLFNDGSASGKRTYAGSSLSFERVGDTYTLSSATVSGKDGKTATIDGLQTFFKPSPYASKVHDIFTNNFWPLDAFYTEGSDGLWGKYNNCGSFAGYEEWNDGWKEKNADFPAGDDGNAHNWFFGMNFAIDFTLTEDYVGPLDYYFFGDDDMWVFLDGQLVCDIGGVHSSIGEYVNLRDYLPVGAEGTAGQHTLSFFYTERGASGSTCYMSFTLPSVSSSSTGQDAGSLEVSKKVDTDSSAFFVREYEFKVDVFADESAADSGEALSYVFPYCITSADSSEKSYGAVKSGGVIKLKHGQTATVNGLPEGAFYKVTEQTIKGYKVTVNGAAGFEASGSIKLNEVVKAAFVNTPYYELPETGGIGNRVYVLAGLACLGVAVFGLCFRVAQRRRGPSDS